MRFSAEQRLRRQSDFRHARQQGRRFDCGAFTLWYAPRRDLPPGSPFKAPTLARVGVVASTAAVGNAVQRARAKRRLRELWRNHQHLVPITLDVLMIARGNLNGLEYAEIERRFVTACGKLFPPR